MALQAIGPSNFQPHETARGQKRKNEVPESPDPKRSCQQAKLLQLSSEILWKIFSFLPTWDFESLAVRRDLKKMPITVFAKSLESQSRMTNRDYQICLTGGVEPSPKKIHALCLGKIDSIGELEIFKKYPNIKKVSFSWWGPMTELCIQALIPLSHLEHLCLPDNANLQALSELSHLTLLDFNNYKPYDEDLLLIQKCTNLKHIKLWRASRITDVGLKALEGLTNLESLFLAQGERLTNDGMQSLSTLRKLTNLDLHCKFVADVSSCLSELFQLTHLSLQSQITADAALLPLAFHSRLQALNLCSTEITDVGVQSLMRLPMLTELRFPNCTKVTEIGVQCLAQISSLNLLMLNCLSIPDDGFKVFSTFSNLKNLSLRIPKQLSNNGMQALGQLHQITSLTELSFEYCNVSNQGLSHLRSLSNLCRLTLMYCQNFTINGLVDLTALPRLQYIQVAACEKTRRNHISSLKKLPKSQRSKIKGLSSTKSV